MASDLAEPIRPLDAGGCWGYVDPIGVEPGGSLRVHLSAPAAHDVRLLQLGERSITTGLDPDADRADATVLEERRSERARPHPVTPGSYVLVGGPALTQRPLTVGAWVRFWRIPIAENVSWNWSTIVGDFDFPDRCHWALLVDQTGRPGVYHGDGGPYRSDWLHLGALGERVVPGRWTHLVAVMEPEGVAVFLDARHTLRAAVSVPLPRTGEGRLRLGASAQRGVVDNFLDGDLAQPFAVAGALRGDDVARLRDDLGARPVAHVLGRPLAAWWPLDERRGAGVRDGSGNGRDGRIVNHATRGIPGPSAAPGAGQPGYEPAADARRGSALRLSSDDLTDCAWPVAETFDIPGDAAPGFYAVEVQLAGQPLERALHIPFVVTARRGGGGRRGAVALLVPVFTWAAYGRVPLDDVRVHGLASSFYTRHSNGRMHFHVGLRMPMPRVIPFAPRTHRPAHTDHRHLVVPERLAAAWLRAGGYRFECLTDVDLDADPDRLEGYAALMIVGHSEYWSDALRRGVAAYLDAGGDVVCLSGNTLYWRVSFDRATGVLESRKTSTDDQGDDWLPPAEWGERWHCDGRPGGQWTLVGEPAHEVLGLETLGWCDEGDATAFAAYSVRAPDHFLLHHPEPVPIGQDGRLGTRCVNGPAASGYEVDGLPETVGLRPETRGRVVLATAYGQAYVESVNDDPSRGADLLYWERPAGGRVFHAGSIAYSGCLPVDPAVAALTRNVLAHFGVPRHPAAPAG